MKRALVFLLSLLAAPCIADTLPVIRVGHDAPHTLVLAAQEIRRYVFLRTGVLCEIDMTDGGLPDRHSIIVLATKGSKMLELIPISPAFRDSLEEMRKDEHALRTLTVKSSRVLLIVGYDDIAALYGAYAFAEKLGIRFHAHGDVIPEGKAVFRIPDLNDWYSPLFAVRGLQPFHDFPEGPDWWSLDDYRAMFSQMVKMKMNFFGLHTYPEGGIGPEPTVWIGLKEDILPGGRVSASYPARYYTTTGDPCWGYNPRKTGDYLYGFGQLFDADSYGAEVMRGVVPHAQIAEWVAMPKEELWKIEPRKNAPAEWNEVFARTAGFYASAFTFGRGLGIKMCIGTETPLTIPAAVKSRIRELNRDTTEARLRLELYEGMFERIKQTVPLDYYWFWTPEDWTWSGNTQEGVAKTRMDLDAAQRAAENVKAPFSLATCGWVLGPKDDRSMFDTFLPKTWAISCISRDVGYAPVDPGFARISGREKWAIPWLEDDPALIIPQLWAGRMRRDAADALAFGCTGLIGIHWRTRVLSPNIAALARAGWDQKPWNSRLGEKLTPGLAVERAMQPERVLPCDDFYADWAESNFGRDAGAHIAAIFARLDGLEKYDRGRASTMNMPVPSDWVGGPGGVKADSMTWDQRKELYAFVDELEALRPQVAGPENLERFNYWLDTFKYLRAVGKFACSAGEVNRLLAQARKDSLGVRAAHLPEFVKLRTRQMQELEEVFQTLLRTVNTNGELGTVANWQQHNLTFFVTMPGHEIERLLGQTLPESCWPSSRVLEQERIIVPTVRTLIRKGEDLQVRALLPWGEIKSAKLCWKPLGAREYAVRDLEHVNRSVWQGTIRAGEIGDDLEYYLEATTPKGIVRFPAGAPRTGQTVVVY